MGILNVGVFLHPVSFLSVIDFSYVVAIFVGRYLYRRKQMKRKEEAIAILGEPTLDEDSISTKPDQDPDYFPMLDEAYDINPSKSWNSPKGSFKTHGELLFSHGNRGMYSSCRSLVYRHVFAAQN